jgi:Flp pilus assembly protein TadG
MRRAHSQRGSSVLYVVVLSPILMLSMALAVEASAVQLQRQRLHSALDQAVVTGASVGASGGTQATLDRGVTAAAARQAIADNLRPLSGSLGDVAPDQVAAAADVVIITQVPADDPLQAGRRLLHPTLELRITVPVHSGLFAAAGLPQTIPMTLISTGDLREVASQ